MNISNQQANMLSTSTTRFLGLLSLAQLLASSAAGQDTLGFGNGYLNRSTKNFDIQIVRDAQTLASLRPAGSSFDFLPLDYLPRRARNGQYHWGDVTLRYREVNTTGNTPWVDIDSAKTRKTITSLRTDGQISAANLAPTLPTSLPLDITREWIDVAGDLGLRFTLTNTGKTALEIGSLGFPAEFNSIFTGRSAEQIQQKCSLADPYIGMHAGYIRVVPVRGTGAALVVTALGGTDTPLEAWRNLAEASYSDTGYASQTFEGYYEWQVLSNAWATKEWASTDPWNPPNSRVLQPGQVMTFGVRFSLVKGGVRDTDKTLSAAGVPVAVGAPGYVVTRDSGPAQLSVRLPVNLTVISVKSDPPTALRVTRSTAATTAEGVCLYQVTPDNNTWGRARLSLSFSDGRIQTVHYFIPESASVAVAGLGRFLTTKQWFTDTSDPFGRAPSVMTYDYETKSIVTQDPRVWIAGLSDEGGAGSFLAAAIKQAVQPSADEISKLEQFVDGVLWGRIQSTTDYAVRKSIFFYQPSAVSYIYSRAIDWRNWWSWDKAAAYATDRAYDYVHVAATYWALYRAGRAYPDLLKRKTWDWYLDQAHKTVIKCMTDSSVGYSRDGLMGETVFGEILADLKRERRAVQATAFESAMRARARLWDAAAVPFGSEMAWDSTGQEGIYYWSRYFGYNATATKTLNTVLGYDPTVPHWGWNGNARRYWDNVYGGKLQRIERQIHHYGSGLNALVLLSAFRSDPSDTYLLRVGYGGMTGPLTNINREGFASASFHSWPETLKWDGYSGDYGPNFVGLALGSGTYLVEDNEFGGLVVYGGSLDQTQATKSGVVATVQTQDAFRRRVFIGPLKLLVSVDAGVIVSFTYRAVDASVSLLLSQMEGGPMASSAVVWLETTAGTAKFTVTNPGLAQTRLGWQVPLSTAPVTVVIGKA
ncbi:hypothetical protein B0H66DRAFT_620425 [Apodospora peruviana]|uniref:Uncharacterized protein n=1 Tax=Apodospora peruviana TaxID=516989 RepID=A0AAE0M995_9PEZI|nr:hypothetical protein B0H66DRAFT_620425 [Apodospora peruviana]